MTPLSVLTFMVAAFAADTSDNPNRPAHVRRAAVHNTATRTAPLAKEKPAQARTVVVGPKDLISVHLRINYSTMLVLPHGDTILEVTCGDKEGWVVNGAENIVHVKPTREGARTNLNVITRKGRYFSFLLNEVSPAGEADLKLFIEPNADLFILERRAELPDAEKDEIPRLRKELSDLKAKLDEKKPDGPADSKRTGESTTNRNYGYQFEPGAPFYISEIYDDGAATYIKANPLQAPSLYELVAGKRVLSQFSYRNGVYITGKVLDEGGCLVLGTRSSCFSRKR